MAFKYRNKFYTEFKDQAAAADQRLDPETLMDATADLNGNITKHYMVLQRYDSSDNSLALEAEIKIQPNEVIAVAAS